MSKIVAVHREDGRITSYKTDDNTVVSGEDAIRMADSGELEGVSSFTTRDGSRALRSDRGQDNYSLSDLPEF